MSLADASFLQIENVANPSIVFIGGLCSYSYTIRNPSASVADNLVVNILPGDGMREISLPNGCSRTDNTTILCTIGSIAPGGSFQLALNMQLVEDVGAGIPITGIATVGATGFEDVTANSVVYQDHIPLTTVTLDVFIAEYVPVNQSFSVGLIITNRGTVTATNVVVTLTMDAGSAIAATGPANCEMDSNSIYSPVVGSGPTLRCFFGDVPPNLPDGLFMYDVILRVASEGALSAAGQIFFFNPSPANFLQAPSVAVTRAIQ